jgi:hypothetical protein
MSTKSLQEASIITLEKKRDTKTISLLLSLLDLANYSNIRIDVMLSHV